MDRKEFFSEAFSKAAGKALELLESTKIFSETPQKKQRPPGASHTESEFLKRCTGCDACMAACPVNVIMIDDLERRDPIIYPDKQPCIHCPGYPCIASCPTGALDLQNGIRK